MRSLDLNREQLLQSWLAAYFPHANVRIKIIAGDASFRRYFRVSMNDDTYIVMDAPPDKERCDHYVAIARAFDRLGLHVPKIFAQDLNHGFLLLSDLGDSLLLSVLNETNVDASYKRAMDSLFIIQSCEAVPQYVLPFYDRDMYLREMNLFRDWYLKEHLGIIISDKDHQLLDRLFNLLITEILQQPIVCVHRDYHSRNLMLLDNGEIGVLDFQDAVWGPITYDLLSLLRDCYIDWPPEQVEAWVQYYREQSLARGLHTCKNEVQFLRWFDWVGLQRNLKCIGIFARLNVRDQKPGYLKDIPRVIRYALAICDRYPEFAELKRLLESTDTRLAETKKTEIR